MTAGLLGFIALAVLVTASLIRPDPRGMGTHQQLGLPPCGWVIATNGYPCPTCGMTTAFSAAAHANPGGAIKAQFFGAGLAMGTAVFFWGCVHVAVFGSMLGRLVERMLVGRVLWAIVVVFLAAWAVKAMQMKG